MTSSSYTELKLFERIFVLKPWGDVSYEHAQSRQRELLQNRDSTAWVLFAPPPTLTLGLRALESDILLPTAELRKREIQVLRTSRGGQVTYHGPSQCVGFPVGTLESFTGDPRGVRPFLQRIQESILQFVKSEYQRPQMQRQMPQNTLEEAPELTCRQDGAGAGIWATTKFSQPKKLVAFGMKFTRQGIEHGFAMNLWPDENFKTINACGQPGAQAASLWPEKPNPDELQEFIKRFALALSETNLKQKKE